MWDQPGDSGPQAQAQPQLLTCHLFSQPAVELPPFSGSDLCVEGISVKKAKKQMPPITSINFSETLSETPLKARSPRTLPDSTVGPRMTLRQDWKREEAKVLSSTWSVPVLAARQRSQAKPTFALPVSNYQHVDSKALKSTFTRTQSSKHLDLNLGGVQCPALVLQNMKAMAGHLSPPLKGPGNHREPMPFCPIVFGDLWLHPNPRRRPSSCVLQNRVQGWIRSVP